MKRTKKSICDEAKEITSKDRMKDYGHPKDNFGEVAELWQSYLQNKNNKNVNVTANDVAMMMILLKVARQKNSPKRDNLVDICGYARCAAIISGEE